MGKRKGIRKERRRTELIERQSVGTFRRIDQPVRTTDRMLTPPSHVRETATLPPAHDVPPVLSYSDVEKFPYVYGFDVESGEVNVFTLTPALEAFARAVNEASKTLDPEAPTIVVRIRPFKKGSLLADLILTAPAWAPLMVHYGHSSISHIQKVLEIIGFIKSKGQSVLKVIDALRRPPTKIEELLNGGFRYHSPDVKNPINVDAPVHKIVQNNIFINNFYEAVGAPLEKERDRFTATFWGRPRMRILLEASTESEWVAQHLETLGHEVIVADPNYAPMYGQRSRRVKTDRRDVAALTEACQRGIYRLAHRRSAQQHAVQSQLNVRRNRTGFAGGPIQREDGTHGTTEQAFPRVT